MGNKKELMAYLTDSGLCDYGSVISSDMVRQILGITYPDLATKAEFDEIALRELSAIDYCRNILLKQGKYLAQRSGDYRILLPSENRAQVFSYMRSADRKLKHAMMLEKSSPAVEHQAQNTQARIMLKLDSIERMNKRDIN